MRLRLRILHRDWKTGVPTDFRDTYRLLLSVPDDDVEELLRIEQWFNLHTDARFHIDLIDDEIVDPYQP